MTVLLRMLASVSFDEMRLWDVRSAAVLRTLHGHTDYIRAIAFSPDGKLLASASNDTTIKVWDTDSGAAIQALKDHNAYVTAVAFSPDGKLLVSASGDKTVRLWGARSN